MRRACRKCWSAIVFTWLSRGKWGSETRRYTQLKIEWRSLRCRLSVTLTFGKASRNFLAWRCTEMGWRDYGGLTKVTRWHLRISRKYGRVSRIGFSTSSVYSAQPSRTGVPRDSGANHGLRNRSAAIAQTHQVALEIVRDDDHVAAALQRESFAELQQVSGIASPEVTLRRCGPSQRIVDARQFTRQHHRLPQQLRRPQLLHRVLREKKKEI